MLSSKSCFDLKSTGLLVVTLSLAGCHYPETFIDHVGFQLLGDLFIETGFNDFGCLLAWLSWTRDDGTWITIKGRGLRQPMRL